MSKQEKGMNNIGDNIIIPGSMVDRVISLCERGLEGMNNSDERKNAANIMKANVLENEDVFIKDELECIKKSMKANKDKTSEEYKALLRVYKDMLSIATSGIY